MDGEGCDKILELSALSCNMDCTVAWKETIDLTKLARKRWVEKRSMGRIAAEIGWGRKAVIRYLGKIRSNPDLVKDGKIRLLIYRRKKTFMGAG